MIWTDGKKAFKATKLISGVWYHVHSFIFHMEAKSNVIHKGSPVGAENEE